MTTIALTPRATPSLYSGLILALIALAFALQASFLVGLANGRLGFSPPSPPVTEMASLPTPCATP